MYGEVVMIKGSWPIFKAISWNLPWGTKKSIKTLSKDGDSSRWDSNQGIIVSKSHALNFAQSKHYHKTCNVWKFTIKWNTGWKVCTTFLDRLRERWKVKSLRIRHSSLWSEGRMRYHYCAFV